MEVCLQETTTDDFKTQKWMLKTTKMTVVQAWILTTANIAVIKKRMLAINKTAVIRNWMLSTKYPIITLTRYEITISITLQKQ